LYSQKLKNVAKYGQSDKKVRHGVLIMCNVLPSMASVEKEGSFG